MEADRWVGGRTDGREPEKGVRKGGGGKGMLTWNGGADDVVTYYTYYIYIY